MAKGKLLMKAMTGFRFLLAGRTMSKNTGSEKAASPFSTEYADFDPFV